MGCNYDLSNILIGDDIECDLSVILL